MTKQVFGKVKTRRSAEYIDAAVGKELEFALKKFGTFHSVHEAFAVILEEVEEAKEEMEGICDMLDGLWNCIRQTDVHEAHLVWLGEMESYVDSLIEESIQVAAVLKKTRAFLESYPE